MGKSRSGAALTSPPLTGLQAASAKGLRLGSPAPNPCGGDCVFSSDPFAWWDSWQSSCQQKFGRKCRADFIASHFYTCDPSALASCAQRPLALKVCFLRRA